MIIDCGEYTAKKINTDKDLNVFSQILTRITIEAVLNDELVNIELPKIYTRFTSIDDDQ